MLQGLLLELEPNGGYPVEVWGLDGALRLEVECRSGSRSPLLRMDQPDMRTEILIHRFSDARKGSSCRCNLACAKIRGQSC